MNEIIDVVIPVYNTGKYLDECLSSFQKQHFKDYKIFIVYDVCSDDSLNIINEYQKIFPNSQFEILYSTKKDGLGAARDFALNSGRLKGKYVIFPDSDDYVDPDYLQKLYDVASKTEADITYCGFTRFDDETKKTIAIDMIHNRTDFISDVQSYNAFLFLNPSAWNKLYRLSLFIDNNIRFTNIKRCEDLLCMLRLYPYLKSIAFVNESLYNYRIRSDSLSNTFTIAHFNSVIDGFRQVLMFYKNRNLTDNNTKEMFEAIGFIRIAIGTTYRTLLSEKHNKRKIMKISRNSVVELFPNYMHNRLLSYNELRKNGFKAKLIWHVRSLYRMHFYWVFTFGYYICVKVLKKEIKW